MLKSHKSDVGLGIYVGIEFKEYLWVKLQATILVHFLELRVWYTVVIQATFLSRVSSTQA